MTFEPKKIELPSRRGQVPRTEMRAHNFATKEAKVKPQGKNGHNREIITNSLKIISDFMAAVFIFLFFLLCSPAVLGVFFIAIAYFKISFLFSLVILFIVLLFLYYFVKAIVNLSHTLIVLIKNKSQVALRLKKEFENWKRNHGFFNKNYEDFAEKDED